MSVKAKIAAGAATSALARGGLGLAGTLTASAATPSCGSNCAQLFAHKYGPSTSATCTRPGGRRQAGHLVPGVQH